MDNGEPRLTPTQDLILSLLGARTRTGESLWTFDIRTLPAARGLASLGLVTVMDGNVERTYRASLTDAGLRTAVGSSTYIPPVARLHDRDRHTGTCTECGKTFPCPTRQMTQPLPLPLP